MLKPTEPQQEEDNAANAQTLSGQRGQWFGAIQVLAFLGIHP
jgi:hypothetical protein